MLVAQADSTTQATGGHDDPQSQRQRRWHWQPLADPALKLITPARVADKATLMAPASGLMRPIRPSREALVEALKVASALGAVSDEAIQSLVRATTQDQAPEITAWQMTSASLGGWLEGQALAGDAPAVGVMDESERRRVAARLVELAHRGGMGEAHALEAGQRLMRPVRSLNDEAAVLRVRARVCEALEDYCNDPDKTRIAPPQRVIEPGDSEPDPSLRLNAIDSSLQPWGDNGYAVIIPADLVLCETPGEAVVGTGALNEALKQGLAVVDDYLRAGLPVGGLIESYDMFFDETEGVLAEIEAELDGIGIKEAEPETLEQAIEAAKEGESLVEELGIDDAACAVRVREELDDQIALIKNWGRPKVVDTPEQFASRVEALPEPDDEHQRLVVRWLNNVATTVTTRIDPTSTLFDLVPDPNCLMHESLVLTPAAEQCPEAYSAHQLIDNFGEMQMQGDSLEELVTWDMPLGTIEAVIERSHLGGELLNDLGRITHWRPDEPDSGT